MVDALNTIIIGIFSTIAVSILYLIRKPHVTETFSFSKNTAMWFSLVVLMNVAFLAIFNYIFTLPFESHQLFIDVYTSRDMCWIAVGIYLLMKLLFFEKKVIYSLGRKILDIVPVSLFCTLKVTFFTNVFSTQLIILVVGISIATTIFMLTKRTFDGEENTLALKVILIIYALMFTIYGVIGVPSYHACHALNTIL